MWVACDVPNEVMNGNMRKQVGMIYNVTMLNRIVYLCYIQCHQAASLTCGMVRNGVYQITKIRCHE